MEKREGMEGVWQVHSKLDLMGKKWCHSTYEKVEHDIIYLIWRCFTCIGVDVVENVFLDNSASFPSGNHVCQVDFFLSCQVAHGWGGQHLHTHIILNLTIHTVSVRKNGIGVCPSNLMCISKSKHYRENEQGFISWCQIRNDIDTLKYSPFTSRTAPS